MRVDSTVLMLLDNPFVADYRVEKEAQSLVENNFNVIILATDENDLLSKQEKRGQLSILRQIKQFIHHPLAFNYQKELDALAKETAKFNFQILHCHDFKLLELACKIKALLPHIYLVYDSHEYLRGWPYYKDSRSFVIRSKGWLVWSYFVWRERKFAEKADLVLCPSQLIAERLKDELNLDALPLAVRNVPNKDFKAIVQFNLREKLTLPSNAKIFVHSGNIHQSETHLNKLLNVICKHPDYHVLFVGNRPHHQALKNRIAEDEKLRSKVHFMNFESAVLPTILSQCTAGIAATEQKYLAHKIGSSNRIMEYSKMSLPIMATDQENHRRNAEQYRHIVLYKPNQESSIEKAISSLLHNYSTLKEAAYTASNSIDWEIEFHPVVARYKTLATSTYPEPF